MNHMSGSALAEAAWNLAKSGYGPVPVRTGAKSPPAEGFTGAKAPGMPSYRAWEQYVEVHSNYMNLGVRLPEGVIGIDVDAYKDAGARSYARLGGIDWPPTILVSSRLSTDLASGIRLYRLPPGIKQEQFVGGLEGIETIRFGHRYLMAPGSVHPEGRIYQALDQRTGEILEELPAWESLPEATASMVVAFLQPDRSQTRATAPPGPSSLTTTGTCRATAAALRAVVWEDGSRYEQMNRAIFHLVMLHGEGHLGVPEALETLRASYVQELTEHPVLGRDPDSEFDRSLRGAQAQAVEPESVCDCDTFWGLRFGESRGSVSIAPAGTQLGQPGWTEIGTTPIDLWTARPIFTVLREYARGRMVSPWAVLGCFLARVAAEVPPWVLLPETVGGPGSLNLYVCLVGYPGQGKSAAHSVTGQLGALFSGLPDGWTSASEGLGSGEGMLKVYAIRKQVKNEMTGEKEWKREWLCHRAIFYTDEIGLLENLSTRSGSTMPGLVRSAWNGTELKLSYADPTKYASLESHSYRMSIVVGAQPGMVDWLLQQDNAGTPQRYLFMTTHDPDAQIGLPVPAIVPVVRLPRELYTDAGDLMDGGSWPQRPMRLDPTIKVEIQERRLAAIQTQERSPGNEHADLMRMKVAAILAIADARLEVTRADWDLAGLIQAHSDERMEWLINSIRQEKAQSRKVQAVVRAEDAVHEEQAKIKLCAQSLAKQVTKHQTKHPSCSRSCLREYLGNRKGMLDAAIQVALEQGWLISETGEQGGIRYRTQQGEPQ